MRWGLLIRKQESTHMVQASRSFFNFFYKENGHVDEFFQRTLHIDGPRVVIGSLGAGGIPSKTIHLDRAISCRWHRTLALPHVQSGRLRYLAMYGNKRWAQAPDVPTLSELGVPIDFVPWTGLFAPSGTPPEVLATLRRALRAASQDSQFIETVGKSSAGEISYLDGSELEAFWKTDLARTSVTIQRIGRVQ